MERSSHLSGDSLSWWTAGSGAPLPHPRVVVNNASRGNTSTGAVAMAEGTGDKELLRTIDLGPDSLLYFVHIPKTAGSSLYEYLDTVFLPQQVFPADRVLWHRKILDGLPAEAINTYSCVRGHLYTHQLDRFWKACRRRVIPFTVLRHPEAQLLSEYDMLLHDENMRSIEIGADPSLTFIDFLRDPKFLLHWMDNSDLANATPGDRQAAHLLMQFERDPYSIPRDEWFDRVVEKLEDYALVGTVEQFDRTLQLMSYIFGWTCPHRAPHRNKMRGVKPVLTAEERELLAEINAVDIKLYDWATTRFEKQYSEMLARLGITADGDAVSAITNASGPRLADRVRARAGDAAHFEVIHNEGLLLGHVSPSRPQTLNWIGPDRQATIRIAFTSAGSRVLYVEFIHWVSRRLLRGFQVFLNGRCVPLVAHLGQETVTYVGYVPESWLGTPGSIVDVQLVAAEASSPAIEGTNPIDSERKSLGLAALNFLPVGGPIVI